MSAKLTFDTSINDVDGYWETKMGHEPEIGDCYWYKGNLYRVEDAGAHVKVKDPDSGNWHQGVRYVLANPADEIEAKLNFTRQRTDFNAKFEFQAPAVDEE